MKRRVALLLAIITSLPLLGYLGYLALRRDIYTDPRPEEVAELIEELKYCEYPEWPATSSMPTIFLKTAAVFGMDTALKDWDRDRNGAKLEARFISAWDALVRIGEPAVPVLIESLKSSDLSLSFSITHILGNIGPEAKEAIPALKAKAESVKNGLVTDANLPRGQAVSGFSTLVFNTVVYNALKNIDGDAALRFRVAVGLENFVPWPLVRQ